MGRLVTPTFQELKRRTHDNLIAFLNVELELGATYCDLTQHTGDQVRYTRLMGDIQEIVHAIRFFAVRIADRSLRADILKKADSLNGFLADRRRLSCHKTGS
jgi:hypothetical protein